MTSKCTSCGKKNKPEQTKENIEKQTGKPGSISMIKSFAMSMVSRGLGNNKVAKAEKQLRVLSCFGNENIGGELPPCEYLRESSTEGKFFCGGCGCGDKKGTWLVSDGDEYSKLDYPKLNCPLQMPGFTNYQPSTPDEEVEPVTRRYYIENINYDDLQKVSVTTPETPPNIKEMLDKVNSDKQEG
jgi:hypothetical protein